MKIGIDIGGSHIGIGLVENNGTIVLKKEIYIKEKTDIENRIERYITENVIEILQAYGVNQIGIAVPGTVTDKKIIKANKEVERYKTRLEAKFNSMDMLIAQMQQQYSSFLKT